MREYKVAKERVIDKLKVSVLQCDICNTSCPNPEQEDWGDGGWTDTVTRLTRFFCHELDSDIDSYSHLDICPECFEFLKNHSDKIKRIKNETQNKKA